MSPIRVLAPAVALTALLFSVSAAGQEKDDPIVGAVKPHLTDASKPFTMLVHIKVKDGSAEKFEAAFAKAVKGTRQEKGNLAYDLNRDAQEAGKYLVYERWRNLAGLEAHVKTPHITSLLAEVGDMLAAPPEIRVLTPAAE